MSFLRLALAGATSLMIATVGCAATAFANSAAETCFDEFEDNPGNPNPALCDGYVAAAKKAGDKEELFTAYSLRSLFWQIRGDLAAAMRDADLAIATQPDLDYGHAWRAVLTGESGEYRAALDQLNTLERRAPQKDFYADMAMLEYVIGDLGRAAGWFRAASAHAPEVDDNDERAIEYRFDAALVEYEMAGGDLAPLRAFDAPKVRARHGALPARLLCQQFIRFPRT